MWRKRSEIDLPQGAKRRGMFLLCFLSVLGGELW